MAKGTSREAIAGIYDELILVLIGLHRLLTVSDESSPISLTRNLLF